MNYTVLITPTADAEISEAFAYIRRDSPSNARRWLAGLYEAIDGLELFPNRCLLAPETEYLGLELRHLVFKSYRVIFRVEEETCVVRVIGVRHTARRPIGDSDQPD